MGAYGSPDLPPLRPPVPGLEQSYRHHRELQERQRCHRSLPVRMMQWSVAVIAVSFAALVAVSVIIASVDAAHGVH